MLQRFCAFLFFRVCGWRVVGEIPKDKKYILVFVPHTSNWDFFYGWLAVKALKLDLKVFVKDAFFIWPFNYACAWFGVLPVNRRKSTNFVGSAAAMFEQHESLVVVIAPEGTRSYQAQLKSGYYYLAKEAKLPIVLAGPNFDKKTFDILPSREPLASFDEDQEQVVQFCRQQVAKHPNNTFH